MPAAPRGPRVPRLAVVAWTFAALVLTGVALAVWHYLAGDSMAAMPGRTGVADAMARGGADPFGPLFGTRLVTAWQLDALALAVLVLAAAWYLTGVALVPLRTPGARWPAVRTLAFLAGIAVCAFATNGSIAVYDQALFTAHMAGHLALLMLAPALLVTGRPLRLAIEATRAPTSDRIAALAKGPVVSLLVSPPVALASYAGVIVGSHLTGLMDTIMRNTWAGQLEHVVYVLVGCQFFALVVGDEPIRWRLASPARWLLLAVAMAVDTFTGIVLMQGSHAVALLPASGLQVDALSDTRTGGAIMWFGGDAIMALVMVTLVIGWLRRVDTARADEKGWLEQARRAAFAEHTGATHTTAETFDDDDEARRSYNAWLAGLDQQR
ncbi:MAG: cytochrome c oxidase assembly protein [Jatrophihabitantaceae bacterium]